MGTIATGVSRWAIIVGAVCLAGLQGLTAAPVAQAQSLSDPTTIEIEDAKCFRHMLEADDYLCVARYNIVWANESDQPVLSVDQAFEFLYEDESGCTVGNITAFPFHNLGYGKGLVAFYFEGNNTACGSQTPDWEELGNITVQGNAYFGSPPPSDTYTLAASDYTEGTSPADIREELRQYLIAQALFLELDWNQFWVDLGASQRTIDLLTFISSTYTVLSTSGEAYLTEVIDDLQDMCPLLFSIQITTLEAEENEYDYAMSEEFKGTFDDTPIGDAMEASSSLLGGVGVQVVGTIATVLAVIAVMVVCARKWQRASPGILIAFPLVIISVRAGFFEMAIMAVFVALCALMLGYFMFFKPAAG